MRRRTILGLLGGAAAVGYWYSGSGTDSEPTADVTPSNGSLDAEREPAAEEPSVGAIDPAATETAFIERFNAWRQDTQLGTVSRDRFMSEMGQAHAENMAQHDYVGHVEPDTGMSIADRYRKRGLLPRCELDVPGTDEYYPGAENAAGASIGRVTHPGTDKTFTVTDGDSLAAFLLSSWVNSDKHRAVMVLPAVNAVGLGVAVRSDGEIFAALEFC